MKWINNYIFFYFTFYLQKFDLNFVHTSLIICFLYLGWPFFQTLTDPVWGLWLCRKQHILLYAHVSNSAWFFIYVTHHSHFASLSYDIVFLLSLYSITHLLIILSFSQQLQWLSNDNDAKCVWCETPQFECNVETFPGQCGENWRWCETYWKQTHICLQNDRLLLTVLIINCVVRLATSYFISVRQWVWRLYNMLLKYFTFYLVRLRPTYIF